jgi:predicted TIM-barrel fold metal-dependent hydrolase
MSSLADEPSYLRRMMDLDSHEMIPSPLWEREFGEAGAIISRLNSGVLASAGENSTVRTDVVSDTVQITEETVWTRKGPSAPAAIELDRRPAVLAAMGVKRQLVFPTFGLIGMSFLYHGDQVPEIFGFDPASLDRFEVGRKVIAAHNAWAARVVKEIDPDQVRPVGLLLTDSLDQMMRDAEAALDTGVRAFWISSSTTPAGTSPGDRYLDPFWRLVASADATITLHIGTEFGLLSDNRWGRNVPQFAPASASTIEFNIEPYRCSIIHLQCDNFLSAMVLGGVFERHPDLRFGVIECAAHWVGPLAESLDLWHSQFRRRLDEHLTMRPSEYLARNVRVTPFHFEPVDEYIERYPDLRSVYCFSSDYPHVEGGKYTAGIFEGRLRRLGNDVAEDFFVRNGEWLLPPTK